MRMDNYETAIDAGAAAGKAVAEGLGGQSLLNVLTQQAESQERIADALERIADTLGNAVYDSGAKQDVTFMQLMKRAVTYLSNISH